MTVVDYKVLIHLVEKGSVGCFALVRARLLIVFQKAALPLAQFAGAERAAVGTVTRTASLERSVVAHQKELREPIAAVQKSKTTAQAAVAQKSFQTMKYSVIAVRYYLPRRN